MARAVALAASVMAAACGRISFDSPAQPVADAGDLDDAGGVDASVDAMTTVDGAVPAACGGAPFCDDFEDPTLSAWDGLELVGSSTILHAPGQGRTGAGLSVVGAADSDVAAIYADVLPGAATEVWFRLWLYAGSGQTLNGEPVTLADGARSHELVFSLFDDSVDLHAHGMAGDFSVAALTPPPRDRWVCWELHATVAAAGRVELYRDGDLVLASPSVDTRPPGAGLTRLLVGLPAKVLGVTTVLRIDDVAAGPTRPGCL